MGGGTTLVEAWASGRKAIGTDISNLAVFISKVKTTPLSNGDLAEIRCWGNIILKNINLKNETLKDSDSSYKDHFQNISGKFAWPIKKALKLSLAKINTIHSGNIQDFLRCAVLRTAQWALDCRRVIPTVDHFRFRLDIIISEMIAGARELQKVTQTHEFTAPPLCLNRSVIGIEKDIFEKLGQQQIKLVLTSPPYPGVHVLYHRWQVRGRRESSLPFLIANRVDGNGSLFYTLGDRKQKYLSTYFQNIFSAFSSLAKVADAETLFVQLVAFSEPSWQLPKYLDVIKNAGLEEIKFNFVNSVDNRIWRTIPNRKFYTIQNPKNEASKEVVLIHRLYR